MKSLQKSRRRSRAKAEGKCPSCCKLPSREDGILCEPCRLKLVNQRKEKRLANPIPCKQCGLEVPRENRRGKPTQFCSVLCREMFNRRPVARYGVTPAEVQALAAQQDNRCAICRKEETLIRFGRIQPLSIDHDHNTNQVRGLLCHRCNVGLGMFLNNSSTLHQAAGYLELLKAA